jgi:hypothetical protein
MAITGTVNELHLLVYTSAVFFIPPDVFAADYNTSQQTPATDTTEDIASGFFGI